MFLAMVLPGRLLAADAAISLPLQGHYRPGRYMPVKVSAHLDSPADDFTLLARDALTTSVHGSSGRLEALIPWLTIGAVRDVRWFASSGEHAVTLPLQALEDDQRLIGYAGADPDALAATFPGCNLVRVPLDLADPLPGEIAAWEALDGIVLDAAAASRLEQFKVRGLLACGTAIAIRSKAQPGGGWPWKRQGAYWIARISLAGPLTASNGDVYGPTQLWPRGWPAYFRRQTLAAAILFALLATGVALWRGKGSAPAVVLVCLLATGLAFFWRHGRSMSIEAGGDIIVLGDAVTQRDTWTYRAVLRPAAGTFPWQPLARPVFGYRRQAEETDTRLTCSADGFPAEFRYRLKPGQSLAFQTRLLSPGQQDLAITTPITSPLRAMADALYAGAGDSIVGQTSSGPDAWASIVIRRAGARAPASRW